MTIKYLFWNIFNNNIVIPLAEVLIENEIDICSLAECNNLDLQSLLNQLKSMGEVWRPIQIYPIGDILLISKQNAKISVIKEDKHFSSYRIIQKDTQFLFTVVHLISPMHKEEMARNQRACNLSDLIRKIEENVFGLDEFKSIIVGDFNLQPYSQGIAGILGFNATMSSTKAKRKYRIFEGKKRYFYFNPTWKLMGDNKAVQGTYYEDSDQQDLSMFWYSFDEVLIRPYLISLFNWSNFGIIEKTKSFNFIRNGKINDKYSDHLPLKFEIM